MGLDTGSSWYVQVVHSLPHFDLTFRTVDANFDPHNPKYIESIIFWAAVPIVWLLLTLLIFLIYFCTRCCKPQERKHQKSPCLTISIVVIVVLSCCCIGIGFYGNERTTKSVHSVFKIVDRVFTIINNIKDEVLNLQETLNRTLFEGLGVEGDGGISAVVESHPELTTGIRQDLTRHTNRAVDLVKEIQIKVNLVTEFFINVNLSPLRFISDLHELIRWIVMLVVFSCLAFICLIAVIAMGTSSRILLMLFCIFGIISLVICFLLSSLHLAFTVSSSDFCMAPTDYFVKLLSTPADHDVVNYFMTCDPVASNPLNTGLQSALGLLKTANSTVHSALSIAEKFLGSAQLQTPVFHLYGGLNEIGNSLIRLVSLLHCNLVHQLYIDVINVFCTVTISGILFMLLSCCLTGFLLSILILLGLRVCRIIGYNVVQMDNDDYCRGRHGGQHDAVKMTAIHRRTTPPPSYSSSEFYRQYSDVIHTSDESRQESSAS